jgi:hypothetical protein
MRFAVIGCLCAGALAAVGCGDGRGVPTSSSAIAAEAGSSAAVPGIQGTAARRAVLLLTKICDLIDHCSVNTSSSGPVPVGSDVNYFGPLLDSRTTSRIVVTTPAGDTADGDCSLSYKSFNGTCVITGGTGALAGLHANLKVSSDFSDPAHPDGVFTWEGPYHFEP